DDTEQRPLRWIEYALGVEVDQEAQDVVVLKKILERLQFADKPRKYEWIGAKTGKHAKCAVRGRRAFFVVDHEAQRLAIGQGAGPALDRLCPGHRFEPVEFEIEANLAITGQELRGVA